MKHCMKAVIFVCTALAFSLTFGGCVVVRERPVVVKEGGPPPWAPAHGYRAKHMYYYYPEQAVYYDTGRKVYFYSAGGGRWVSTPILPSTVRIDVRSYQVLEMDTDAPYSFHNDVVRRYPPGQAKKFDRGKGHD